MRQISAAETAVVRWLVQHGSDATALGGFEATIRDLKVIKECDCGCPSVDFIEKGAAAPFRILSEAIAKTSKAEMEFILWGDDKRISALEVVVNTPDGKKNQPLPSPDLLRTWEEAGEELRNS